MSCYSSFSVKISKIIILSTAFFDYKKDINVSLSLISCVFHVDDISNDMVTFELVAKNILRPLSVVSNL